MSHDVETLEIIEETTPDYEGTLFDKDEVTVIPGSVLDSLTLTYFQEYSEVIINSRNGQNVLQVNGVTVDELGRIRWTLSLADAVILDDSLHQEHRRKLITDANVTEFNDAEFQRLTLLPVIHQ